MPDRIKVDFCFQKLLLHCHLTWLCFPASTFYSRPLNCSSGSQQTTSKEQFFNRYCLQLVFCSRRQYVFPATKWFKVAQLLAAPSGHLQSPELNFTPFLPIQSDVASGFKLFVEINMCLHPPNAFALNIFWSQITWSTQTCSQIVV